MKIHEFDPQTIACSTCKAEVGQPCETQPAHWHDRDWRRYVTDPDPESENCVWIGWTPDGVCADCAATPLWLGTVYCQACAAARRAAL